MMRTDAGVPPVFPAAYPTYSMMPSASLVNPMPMLAPSQQFPSSQPFVQPVDYWGPQWNSNASNYQWEMQNIRRELDLAYQQQPMDPARQNAQVALEQLRRAEAQWVETDFAAKAEVFNMRQQNADLSSQLQVQHKYAGEAYDRLQRAESNWHSALQSLQDQRFQSDQVQGRLKQVEAEAEMSKAGLLEQLNWHRQQLSRAQEEIRRIRPAEAQFKAVTSEVEYLRAQTAQMRQLEERFANVCKEADTLRAQLVKQEHNIDRYTHQTESFYQSANSENVTAKRQLAAREDELRHLRERFQDAVEEINHSHDQVRRAEVELTRLRAEADDLHDYVSETNYLKHQHGDQARHITHVEDRLERYAADNDALREQLQAADAEVERLSLALGDEATQHRFLEAALNEEIADNKAVRRQLNETVVHQTHMASALKTDAVALSKDAQVKQMEVERLQKMLGETSSELDKYTAMYQEAVVDVDRLKAALTEEITEHKYARGLADQQKRKADMAIEELERIGDPSQGLRRQLEEAESEIIRLRNVIGEYKIEIERLREKPQYRDVVHSPVTVGYNRGEPVLKSADSHTPSGQRFAYFGVEVAEGAYLTKTYGESRPIPAVRVVNVGGPCQEAGLKPGDLISSIKGRQVGSLDDFNAVVSSVSPHAEVKIIFERDGVLLGTDIITEETKQQPGMPGRLPDGKASSTSSKLNKRWK